MPFARSITNGTLIYYTEPYPPLAKAAENTTPRHPPPPPWSLATQPAHTALICKPTATFVIESGRVEAYWTMAPGPGDWRPAP